MSEYGLDYFVIFMTAMVTTLLLVRPIKKLAISIGAVDLPNERKIHAGIVPRLGGLAIFFGCAVAFLIYLDGYETYRGIFLGMMLMVLMGVVDDCVGLTARPKFLVQFAAAAAAMLLSDVNIASLGGVLGSQLRLGWLSWPLTLLWIVGITNAINLSDGIDGLAGGISLIAFTCFGVLAFQRGDHHTFTLCLILTGSILGFLRYNSHPAEVFMGDTGSLFLGYCLAVLSITGNFKSVTSLTLFTPLLVLLLPIADTCWAVIRRVREGRSPFTPDRKHFHHRLLARGMDQSQTVSFIYAMSVVLSVLAVILANSPRFVYLLVPVLAMALALFFGQVFGLLDVVRWSRRLAVAFYRRWPLHTRAPLNRFATRLIQLGALVYLSAFLLGMATVPPNVLGMTLGTIALITCLAFARSPNGQNYLIFCLFFLAAVISLVANHYLYFDHAWRAVPALTEPLGFALITLGVLGKIIFKQKRELFLATPLEFFIFMVLVILPMIPLEMRGHYDITHLTVRIFFLFLGLKAMVLSTYWQSSRGHAAARSEAST